MKKILITGITGFAGSHLAEYLATDPENDLYGTCLNKNTVKNLSSIQDKVKLIEINLTDAEAAGRLIADTPFDEIYHLAALPSPKDSFNDAAGYIHNNIDAELFLLDALVKEHRQNTKVLIVSSADVYGLVNASDLPIDENTPLRPTSPYSISKIGQDYLGLQYSLAYNLHVVRVRPFNHLGARLSDAFAPSAFAKKIVEIEKGKREPVIEVGNLSAKRDYTDVHDIVKAYVLALEKGEKGEVYNIGSGTAISIREILDTLLSLSTVKNIEVKKDTESLKRPIDIEELRCDNTKFVGASTWKPTVSLQQSLEETLEYWRQTI